MPKLPSKIDLNDLPDKLEKIKKKIPEVPKVTTESPVKAIREMIPVLKGAVKATHDMSKLNLQLVKNVLDKNQDIAKKSVEQTKIITGIVKGKSVPTGKRKWEMIPHRNSEGYIQKISINEV